MISRAPSTGQVYRHMKGGKYTVIGTLDDVTFYTDGKGLWYRPTAEWFTPVVDATEGFRTVPRFTQLFDEAPCHLPPENPLLRAEFVRA